MHAQGAKAPGTSCMEARFAVRQHLEPLSRAPALLAVCQRLDTVGRSPSARRARNAG